MKPTIRHTRAFATVVALVVVAGLAAAACGGGVASNSPAASPAPTPGSSASPAPTASPAPPATIEPTATPAPSPTPSPSAGQPGATPPTTTATAWGTIWDAVPADFPVPERAEPAVLDEPISAAWVRGGRRLAIAEGMKTSLVAAGWSIEAATENPDDSVVIEAVKGSPDCRAQVRVDPRGEQIFIIVLYAAACPWS